MTTTQLNDAMFQLVDAIVESVKVAGTQGAPSGILYLALMAHGCTLAQFESIMGVLVRVGKLTKRGETYFVSAAKADYNKFNDGGAQ